MFKHTRASADDLGVLFVGFALAAALTFPAASADAATLVVDRDAQQCPNAGYRTISAAVADADRGDTIEVCPDLYTESVVVNTPDVQLTARGRPEQDCADAAPASADPTQQAIVTAPESPAFDLQADEVTVEGFVLQASAPGIRTGQDFAGYRIARNLLQYNRFGAVFGGSGERLSRLSHNCFRRNGTGPSGGGVFSSAAFGGELRGGRIDHNAVYANNFAIRLGGGEEITVDHNRSLLDGVFIRPAFTRALGILHNRVLAGSGSAIWLFQNPAVPQPNTAAVISHNVITGRGGHALVADPASLTSSLITHNRLTNNALDAIYLQTGNSGNEVAHNRMFGNAEHDAHDDNRAANQWTMNRCQTDFPAGSICAGSRTSLRSRLARR